MEKNIFTISIICISVIKYFLYFCSAMIYMGIFLIILFKDRVMSMLELGDMGTVMNKSAAFPFIIWVCLDAIFILICIIISVTSFQKILKNFRDKEYFSKDNSKYAKEIMISIIILILCKFLAQVSFNYLHITDVSMIYDLSVKDYLFNIFFGIIAFISIILFKNGKKLKDDSESII